MAFILFSRCQSPNRTLQLVSSDVFFQTLEFFSHYYCLDLYRTQNPYLNDTENLSQPAYDIQAVRAWFGILIQDQWHRINMVDFENPGANPDEFSTFLLKKTKLNYKQAQTFLLPRKTHSKTIHLAKHE